MVSVESVMFSWTTLFIDGRFLGGRVGAISFTGSSKFVGMYKSVRGGSSGGLNGRACKEGHVLKYVLKDSKFQMFICFYGRCHRYNLRQIDRHRKIIKSV